MENIGDVAQLGAWATASTMALMQWLKEFSIWRNRWSRVAAPLCGIVILLAWMIVTGALAWTAQGLTVQGMTMFQAILTGFTSGVAALTGYQVQKPLGWLPPGPDNHPADRIKLPINSQQIDYSKQGI